MKRQIYGLRTFHLKLASISISRQKHSNKLYFSHKSFAVVSDKMEKKGRAAVVVLGDLGRSPRMQYHALSLARQAVFDVDIVAYAGTEPHRAVMEHPSIHLHLMRQPIPQGLPRFLYLLALPLKALIQFAILLWYICIKIPSPDLFLVQLFCRLNKAIANPLGIRDCCSDVELVDQRMQIVSGSEASTCLTNRVDTSSTPYQRPTDYDMTSDGWNKQGKYSIPHKVEHTPFTDCMISMDSQGNDDKESISLNENRPALIVSSTSWTPDEDFGMLLEAAIMYDRRVAAVLNEFDSVSEECLWEEFSKGKKFSFPRLLFIITGKGPEREKYEEQIKKLHLKRVAFRTMWLSAADYPLLLGSADLGVSLHTSSSGLDLPMKVVDMFGCGLPVCAVSYSCIKELVEVDENGLLFASSSELADQLLELFKGFPNSCDLLSSLREGALATGSAAKWASEWEEHVMPLLTEVMNRRL